MFLCRKIRQGLCAGKAHFDNRRYFIDESEHRKAEFSQPGTQFVFLAFEISVAKAVESLSGRFQIANLNPGRYVVEVSYVGYKPQYRNLTVADSDIRLRPFRLDPQSVARSFGPQPGASLPYRPEDCAMPPWGRRKRSPFRPPECGLPLFHLR